MKIKKLFFAFAAFVLGISTVKASPLTLKVYTASPEGFMVTSTLISGDKEAILIDGQMTVKDAEQVVKMVQESQKKLTMVYITHSHPDHYFGLNVIKKAFPKIKIVALPSTVQKIKETWKPKVDQWSPVYHDQIPTDPLIPSELKGSILKIGDEKIEITGSVQGDDEYNSYLWIPSLKTVIAGDTVYNGVFPWTAETKLENRKAWLKTIAQLSALNPTRVIAGHKTANSDDNPSSLKFMKEYLTLFNEAVPASKTAEDLVAKIKAKYPSLALDIILNIGANAAIPKAQ